MNDQIKDEVIQRVEQFLAGGNLERNRFDLKKKWYRFNDLNNKQVSFKNEFWKDICAMANSYGAEDGFIVIGVDESAKTLHETKIEDSGLNQSQIKDLVLSNIDRPISIDIEYLTIKGTQLSVIHIPISINKPHLVSEYTNPSGDRSQNVIFIRTGSGTHIAGRGEIDTMYWERNNIQVEKRFECSFNKRDMTFRGGQNGSIIFSAPFSFENIGSRRLSILTVSLTIVAPLFPSFQKMTFKTQLRSQSTPWAKLEVGELESKSLVLNHKLALREEEARMVTSLDNMKNELEFKNLVVQLVNGEEIFGKLSTPFI